MTGQSRNGPHSREFPASGPFPRVWQVLGSNQRRLSRRFYSLRPPPRVTCRLTCAYAVLGDVSMRSLRHVFLALRLRRSDAHGRGGHVHGQRPGERSTDHAAELEEPAHRQGAGNGQLPAAATLTSSSASTCSARPRTPLMAPPCRLPGYLTAAVCALSSGLSRSVAAAASADTIRSVPPPRPYLVS